MNTIIHTKEEYKAVIEKLITEKCLSLDCETTQFDEDNTHSFELDLEGLGVFSDNIRVYIPVQYLDKEFQRVLDDRDIVLHNAKFDLVILQKQGYDISKIKYQDTLIMSWLLNENRTAHRLKYLAEHVLKVKKEKIVEFKQVTKKPILDDYGMFPEEFTKDSENWLKKLGNYCIDDCKYTYKLYQKFKPELEKQGLMKVYEKIELPLIKVVMDMELRGIKIDLEYLKQVKEDLEQGLIKLQAGVWKEAGREFDINSSKQLSEILFKDKKFEVSEEHKTPKGSASTNEKALEFLGKKYPEEKLISLLLEYRELFKLHSTFVIGLLKKHKDGIIYAGFNQMGTKTARFSSNQPNLQQIPAVSKYDIRKAFIARDSYTFIDYDMSQIELRLGAYFSKDPKMMKAFQEGKDIHQETADIVKCTRTFAKILNFAIFYGMSEYGLAQTLKIPVEEARKFIENYFIKFQKLAIFLIQAKNTLQKYYAVRSIMGRKRRFPEYVAARKNKDWSLVKRMERQAVNSIIQSSCADLIKIQMFKIAERIKPFGAYILLTVHDEVIVECPENKAEEVSLLIKDTMENAVKLPGVPIVAEGHISKNWTK